jgi:hypothetical protein
MRCVLIRISVGTSICSRLHHSHFSIRLDSLLSSNQVFVAFALANNLVAL